MKEAAEAFIAHQTELDSLRSNDLEKFSESYELEIFEELDERFYECHNERSITNALIDYLADNIEALAGALAE